MFAVRLVQLDWRPILPTIDIPCLNLVGRLSGVFPWEGCAVVGQLIPDCKTVSCDVPCSSASYPGCRRIVS